MANSLTTQILENGERNVVINIVGILDTADLSNVVVADISALANASDNPTPNRLAIMNMEYSIEPTLSVQVQFDATAQVVAQTLNGYGKQKFENVGGIPNNAGAGVTGDITLSTEGFAALAVLHFSLKLKLKKYTV